MSDTVTPEVPVITLPPDLLPAPEDAPEAPPAPEPEPAKAPEPPKAAAQGPDRSMLLRQRVEAERKFREKEVALKAREAAVAEQQQKQEALAALAKEDPARWLEESGSSVESLTKSYLKGDRPDPTKKVMSEVEKLKQELVERDRVAAKEKSERLYQEARKTVSDYLDTSEKHELAKLMQATDMVMQTIESHYHETGEVLSEEAASDKVEAYLESLAEEFLKANKVKAKATPQAPAKKPTATPKTLTNKQASQVTSRDSEDDLTDEEQLARMVAIMSQNT